TKPARAGTLNLGPNRRGLALAHLYNPPFLQHVALVGGPDGSEAIDVTRRGQPALIGRVMGFPRAPGPGGPKPDMPPVPFADLVVESMPLDRMVDEDGVALKDISHPNARYLSLEELRKVLSVKLPEAERR